MNTLWRQCGEGRGVARGRAWKIAEQQKPTCLAFFSSLFFDVVVFLYGLRQTSWQAGARISLLINGCASKKEKYFIKNYCKMAIEICACVFASHKAFAFMAGWEKSGLREQVTECRVATDLGGKLAQLAHCKLKALNLSHPLALHTHTHTYSHGWSNSHTHTQTETHSQTL